MLANELKKNNEKFYQQEQKNYKAKQKILLEKIAKKVKEFLSEANKQIPDYLETLEKKLIITSKVGETSFAIELPNSPYSDIKHPIHTAVEKFCEDNGLKISKGYDEKYAQFECGITTTCSYTGGTGQAVGIPKWRIYW